MSYVYVTNKGEHMSKEEANNVVYSCPEHGLDTYFKVKEFENKPEAKDYVYVRFVDGDQVESMWVRICGAHGSRDTEN